MSDRSHHPPIRPAAGLAAFALALGTPPALAAQSTARFEPVTARSAAFPLTIENIMGGPELIGQAPTGVSWSDDGDWVYFRWLPGGEDWHADRKLYRASSRGGDPEPVSEEEEARLGPVLSRGDVSSDGRRRAVSSRGDLYLIERPTGAVRRVTTTAESESGVAFSGDGSELFFRRGSDLFAFTLADGAVRQLTRIASGPAPKDDPEPEGHDAFLKTQQEELFEHIRIQKLREDRREEASERLEAGEPEEVYLEDRERAQSLEADPTGRHVAITAVTPDDAETTDIPRWVTDDGYTENTEMRSKVGDDQGASRVGIIEVSTGEVAWLDLWTGVEGADAEDHDDRLAVASFIGWSDDGAYGLAAAMDYDFKELRLYSAAAATGELTLLSVQRDEAWIDGPCAAMSGCAGWLPTRGSGAPRAWYGSEETGYAHLYAIDADGGNRRALTSGEWEVRSAEIPDGWDAFLLHTGETSPHDLHPWRMDFDGSNRVRLLDGDGQFNATPSPDGSRFAVLHSSANRPPELSLADVGRGASLAAVTRSPTSEWLSFDWITPEIVRFEARDGVRVPARIYRPGDFGVPANGAGVVFVHGAGYLQNVHNGWSNYSREYMFHHFLAAQGYTVLDIDYRGSAGYGRDWRTAIYRHMGGWDLSDQVDGAEYLVRSEGVDPDRLGIYGGSYGGFITLMALFTEPDAFEAGAALRAVTDWAHYNHWYTGRILNLPQDDEEAYRQSSPIYFAEGLRGHLLIAHGMYDTNVHFSDVVRLAQRLIELGKENWEMAVYPVESHGFAEPASWTDEYRRIYELFERVIGSGYAAAQTDSG